MKRILSIMEKEGLQCLPCERISLDFERFVEYRDSDEHPVDTFFERPRLSTPKKKIHQPDEGIPTILHYFLDGSRKTYKISDVIVNGRYLPLIAGQIGVAVVRRNSQTVEPVRSLCKFKNVIALPDSIPLENLEYLENEINQWTSVPFSLLRYEVKRDRDPVDLGIAKIMSEMHDLEIVTVHQMAEQQLLANDRLLVIDGPLRFKKKLDLVQFRNVLGISKTFRPTFEVGRGRKRADVGSITSGLDFGERTSVFRTFHTARDLEGIIGVWYLRIRHPHMMSNPLQGIVKVECYAVDPEDRENGFDGERIDVISSHILRERNVTPYGEDLRWASHLYPIYVAECYLKSSFMTNVRFKAMF